MFDKLRRRLRRGRVDVGTYEAPEPTEARPAKKPRKGKSPDTAAATETKPRAPRKPRAKKTDGDAA